MITIRKSHQRGRFDHGWLDTRHTFSFADYYDPDQMGFRALRVINEDRVRPGQGFGTHAHRDMEILSIVLEGALRHRDSMGNGSLIRPGDVQRMTAGTGVRHSELNGSDSDLVHFLQIWIVPERQGLEPGYEQKFFSAGERKGRLRVIGSRDGRDGSVTIHQDIALSTAILDDGESVRYGIARERYVWVQVLRGDPRLQGGLLEAGDGAAVTSESQLTIDGPGEILLFDLA